jgi:hypothetical protein
MRRLEQNGEILIRTLLISGIVIGITMIVGIHPVIGTDENWYNIGYGKGLGDCADGKNYYPNQGPTDSTEYAPGYTNGWLDAGCP